MDIDTVMGTDIMVRSKQMIDLHTHILPAIDDGAQSIAESVALLKEEQKQGVSTVVLTPHYNNEVLDLNLFLKQRNDSYAALIEAVKKENLSMNLLLGAEVYLDPFIVTIDLSQLVIENTNYILLELPVTHFPVNIKKVFYHIRLKGFIPILAHVERYTYFRNRPEILKDLVDTGVLCQINADKLFKWRDQKFIRSCFIHDMVHVLASDTHSLDKRPPLLADAYKKVEKMINKSTRKYLEDNAAKIIQNQPLFIHAVN